MSHFAKRAAPSSGYVNAVSREVQLLPGDWRQLGAADLERITGSVERWSKGQQKLPTLEACLMVHALLTTGRKAEQLADTNFRLISRGANVANAPPGLIKREGKWSWWLPAGGPERKKVEPSPAMLPTCPNLWLPVSAAVRPLIDRCLKKRGLQPHAGPQPLFLTPPHTLRRRVLAILTSRPAGAPKARRSATTVESAERWLLREIAQTAGGDVGAASLITGRTQTLAKPMTYYGALSIPRAISIHERATRRADRHDHDEFPTSLAGLSIGDPDTPKDASVQSLIVRLAADLRCPARDLAAVHRAMIRYTCALLAFALALRGRGALPSFSAVDVRRPAFVAWIDGDQRIGPEALALIFVADLLSDLGGANGRERARKVGVFADQCGI